MFVIRFTFKPLTYRGQNMLFRELILVYFYYYWVMLTDVNVGKGILQKELNPLSGRGYFLPGVSANHQSEEGQEKVVFGNPAATRSISQSLVHCTTHYAL